MMIITDLSHLFKWENLHNWWLTKYFFAPLYIILYTFCIIFSEFIFHSIGMVKSIKSAVLHVLLLFKL